MKTIKWIFYGILVLFTCIWFLISLNILGVYHIQWPLMDSIVNWVNSLYVHTTIHDFGLKAILAGGSIFLGYSVIGFLINKIPLIGKMIMWITGIIGGISLAAVIIGVLLMVLV